MQKFYLVCFTTGMARKEREGEKISDNPDENDNLL
jgi:hypothetical protein